jgi:hypothetical protein
MDEMSQHFLNQKLITLAQYVTSVLLHTAANFDGILSRKLVSALSPM